MAQHDQDNSVGLTDLVVPEAAEQPIAELLDAGQSLWSQATTFVDSLFRVWNLYQIGIVLSVFIAAHLCRALFGPRIRAWMASRENWPKWRLRILAVIHQRLRAIFFVVLIWAVVLIMREVTWPSRSYLLGIVATLATAWLGIVFATRS